jgi:hypothetical protein
MTDARLVIGIIGSPERGELAVEVGGLVGEFGRAEPVDDRTGDPFLMAMRLDCGVTDRDQDDRPAG